MVYTGTSGFNYPEWKGRFYPSDLPTAKMLPYYAGRLPTVEINYTFYRMPTPALLAGWAAQVPEGFRFTLKAPKRITHDRRLKDTDALVGGFVDAAATLGSRLGCLLFQLPPNLKHDPALFDAFLDVLPPRLPAAFEFRHASWFDDAVYQRLADRHLALCLADTADREPPWVATADYGYLRLRDEGYTADDVKAWAARVGEEGRWRESFVYFKHEDAGTGPEFAAHFIESLPPGAAAPPA
jgi:uncharacterized protein YecE (DUF72 family)